MKNIWRKPTALELAAEQLEQAKRSRLEASANFEYWQAMQAMLEVRIARLRDALREAREDLDD